MVVKARWWAGQAEPDLIEVVGELAGDGAVEPCLEVGGLVLVQDVLVAGVLLADLGHPRVDGFAAVHVLRRYLAEEEVDMVADFVGAGKVGLVQHVVSAATAKAEQEIPRGIQHRLFQTPVKARMASEFLA